MSDNKSFYLSKEKLETLKKERGEIIKTKIPNLARRIDEARQMGDLSENAEYHAAREDMGWTKGRLEEIDNILQNAQLISDSTKSTQEVGIGSIVSIKVNGKIKEYTIVGAQEADPLKGKISNESPLGEAFLGTKKGEKIQVEVPAGIQVYEILNVS